MSTLDSILSGGGEAVSEQQTTEEQVTQTVTEGEGQTEQETETEQTEGEGGARVPVAALQAERQKVKRYTEEVADFRKQLAESNAASQRQIAELVEALKPRQEPAPTPDFFENPQAATRHELTQAVTPEFERINQTLMANAQIVAGLKYGDDKVAEAEQAFIVAMQSRTLDPSEYQRVVNSPNRYAAAAEWHKRQQAQAEIGNDPVAFRAKVEAEIRAKLEAEMNGGNGQARPAPGVTPSNLAGARNMGARTGPAWSGPSTIDDIFSRRKAEQ